MQHEVSVKDKETRRGLFLGPMSALLLVIWAAPAWAANPEVCFSVVVHADNPTTEIEVAKLGKMLMKKQKRWDHGATVVPVNQNDKSAVRKSFTKAVHGKSSSAIQTYWQRMIFSGRDVPPREMKTDQEVLDLVKGEPGGVGYVGCKAVPSSGVKILNVVGLTKVSSR
jgi:ABC-type phosphate transport system substrate-binding protein